ncbi:Pentatricopeptide repeat-containing protein [Thalictrum thalictroides]|uniref:Pentatricopeptide repeat-containing protein n=1 Tax=Thalictrum thalictroides TaxID=46969 RepID=A0A7J6WM04_THATH|nr:Pentatricopeptide repeat-containing protein [Thalictrum thalictroides]
MKELKQIHAYMFKTGLVLDTIPASRLLNFCILSDSGNLVYARKIFDRIESPNTFKWNMMIRSYSTDLEEAFNLYHQMLNNSVQQNAYTFPFLLKSCARFSVLEETQQIHSHIEKTGFNLDLYSVNSLLHAYAKSGSLESARRLFDRISQRDAVSWNSMIDAHVKNGEIEMACRIFRQMEMKNVISWTSVIAGCVGGGLFKEAIDLFHEMQFAGVKPDSKVLASTLSACAHLGALEQGRWIHAYVDKNKMQIDQVLGCTLVEMYAKCGDVEQALKVFKSMKNRDLPVWTAMISGFAIHGCGREALQLFTDMQTAEIKPNLITFTSILTACSHAGLVDEGKFLFHDMEITHSLTPSIEHYGCMVNLLGRAGQLKEAEELIKTMPMNPNAAVLGALLSACVIHQNLELGKRVGELLVKTDPDHSGRYIHLAYIFAAAGQWEQAVKLRKLLKDRGVAKFRGSSSIELHGVTHEFLVCDRSHPQMKEIYLMLDRITARLRQVGYVPMTDKLLLDLGEEEKETAIHWHSEKLAIAFGLINSEPGTKIRIVKNLRVCEDCHNVTKLISKIYSREIVMRDRTRFHFFQDGNCSCGDYW